MECKTCRWFVAMVPGFDFGTCHYDPPPAAVGFPQVHTKNFCSKYEVDTGIDELLKSHKEDV